ncbi:MAG: DUF192 domain-containing protein [Verrucomicrobiales bacterium]|nr:DUF192 domain-containing protein [Verrucomicrobiales bacterium]
MALCLVACRPAPRSEAPATGHTPDPLASLDDGHPQSGLRRLKLYLGAQELSTELALTDEAIRKGMMWRTNIPDSDGMLFVFGRPHQTSFWMKNVPMDIDVAYLDPEGVILEIHRLERMNTNPVVATSTQVQYALETAEGWFSRHGLRPGVVVRTEIGSLPDTFFRGQSPR